jgi:LacI family transcriptional regulator
VFPDFEAAGAMAAEHLLSRGFRQFGYLGFSRDIDSRLQFAGFRGVTRREGFRCTVHRFARTRVAGKAPGWTAFVTGLEAWVDSWQPPIGVFVTQDLYCRYLIAVCRSKGLHVSQDVAIVGCHNETAICDSPPPSITSIDLGYAQIGYRAAALLDRWMEGEPPLAEPELVAPAELIPRQTTDSYAVDDPLVARALRFIAENGGKPIQVRDVAIAVATTRRTLERRFRESLGRGIAAEITRLCVERAKRRLVETDASMKTVARDSGFRTADLFYKVFARVEGLPPTRYRAKRRQVFLKRNSLAGESAP